MGNINVENKDLKSFLCGLVQH